MIRSKRRIPSSAYVKLTDETVDQIYEELVCLGNLGRPCPPE